MALILKYVVYQNRQFEQFEIILVTIKISYVKTEMTSINFGGKM